MCKDDIEISCHAHVTSYTSLFIGLHDSPFFIFQDFRGSTGIDAECAPLELLGIQSLDLMQVDGKVSLFFPLYH